MERIQRILTHPQYQQWLTAGVQMEKNRLFCKHDMAHNLAVARIAYMLWLEQGGSVAMKPLFYGAALLHDVGKWQEKQDSAPGHAEVSAALAGHILAECGFDDAEQDTILEAIAQHSGTDRWQEIAAKKRKTFSEVFYLADKLSRSCWECQAKEDCYWTIKNEGLTY